MDHTIVLTAGGTGHGQGREAGGGTHSRNLKGNSEGLLHGVSARCQSETYNPPQHTHIHTRRLLNPILNTHINSNQKMFSNVSPSFTVSWFIL